MFSISDVHMVPKGFSNRGSPEIAFHFPHGHDLCPPAGADGLHSRCPSLLQDVIHHTDVPLQFNLLAAQSFLNILQVLNLFLGRCDLVFSSVSIILVIMRLRVSFYPESVPSRWPPFLPSSAWRFWSCRFLDLGGSGTGLCRYWSISCP